MKIQNIYHLQGKIFIEEKKYEMAINSFKKAITYDITNISFHIWEAYANYLYAEFNLGMKHEKYQEEISLIIRKLERILSKKINNDIKSYILYFLGCFYYKLEDYYSSKETLEDCIRLDCKTEINEYATNLLSNIWNYKIKPKWWHWWWSSPINKTVKRLVFILISSFILILLLLPTFWDILLNLGIKWKLFNEIYLSIESIPYVTLLAILFFIILTPNLEKVKAKDIEFELPAPKFMENILIPIKFENTLLIVDNLIEKFISENVKKTK